MTGRLNHRAQSGTHAYAERGFDLYETPVVATEALLRAEKLPRKLWEPCCGRGAIVNVLRSAGHEVVATDLVNYGVPITPPGYLGGFFGRDESARRRPRHHFQSTVQTGPTVHRARA